VIKERIYFDKTEPGILHDEITVIDNAFTRPWTITKNYRRTGGARPVWREQVCVEHRVQVKIVLPSRNICTISANRPHL
jgi:hypothetical protein